MPYKYNPDEQERSKARHTFLADNLYSYYDGIYSFLGCEEQLQKTLLALIMSPRVSMTGLAK